MEKEYSHQRGAKASFGPQWSLTVIKLCGFQVHQGWARVSGSNAVSWLSAACGQTLCFRKRQINPLGAPWCHVMSASSMQFNLFTACVDIPKLASCAGTKPAPCGATLGSQPSLQVSSRAQTFLGSDCTHHLASPKEKSLCKRFTARRGTEATMSWRSSPYSGA